MPSSLGPAEILVILVVALIVLGPKRLPEAGRQVGRALSEIRRWSRDIQGEVRDAFDIEESRPSMPKTTTAPALSQTDATTTGAGTPGAGTPTASDADPGEASTPPAEDEDRPE